MGCRCNQHWHRTWAHLPRGGTRIPPFEVWGMFGVAPFSSIYPSVHGSGRGFSKTQNERANWTRSFSVVLHCWAYGLRYKADACGDKVMLKREGLTDLSLRHQGKGYRIGKTEVVIAVLAKQGRGGFLQLGC